MCACVLDCVQFFVTPWTSPPGSSVCGIFQARILEWVPFPVSEDPPHLGLNPHLLHLLHFLHWQAGTLSLPHLISRFSLFERDFFFFLRKPYFKRSKNKQSHLHRGDQLGCLKIWNLQILRLCYLEVKKKKI